MTAHQFQLPPRPTVSRRLMTGAILLLIAILSVWLLIAAGLQGSLQDGSVPSILPEGPAVVENQRAITEPTEPIPLPGPALAPR